MADQMVELRENISQSSLYNKDLAPTLLKQRTWNTYNYAALWIGMAHCIPTYMLAGGLIALGMNWKQALFTITLGNLIVLIPMLLNAHPGTKYGIPFPILARASFGVFGANIPALLRAGVACGWFGIQTFIGGAAVNMLFSALIPGWKTMGGSFTIAGLSLPLAICFMIFWLIQIYIIYRGMDLIRRFENWAAPVVIALALILVIWMIASVHGFGPLLAEPSKFKSFGEFFAVFIPSLTGMVGFWATLALNIPDFTRFAKDQKKQMIGQSIGLPPTMLVFSAMGVIITSATVLLYGKAMWDPVEVISRFSNTFVLLLGFFGVIVATLSVNIAANVVSPANDFSNLIPKYISFRLGGLITGIIGILIQPWKLLADPSGYIFGWLGTYSGFLGPIAGVIIADYWVVRRRNLRLADLYKREGAYAYSAGFNWKAIIALVVGVVVALIGRLIPSLKILFDYAWFVGFAAAFIVYSFSMSREMQEVTKERKVAPAV
ncbi:MAG: NCS1 family nucleobase:cation symporter-1 [Syntrophorhabdales bacterium]